MTNHVEFDDIAVDYEVIGEGDQVVLPHARPFVSWYSPLVAKISGYSVLRYRRTLPADRSAFGIDDDAHVCAQLLRHVGFDQPHVVGHSYGGLVALALARREPLQVRSLALLEPAASGFLAPEQARAGLAPLVDAYRSSGPSVAMDLFLSAVCGTDYRSILDRVVPDAFDEAVAHADQFFGVELPAVAQWSFGPDDARGIDRPILSVVGTESAPRFVQGAELLQTWLPNAVRFALPGTGHLLMAQNPQAMAERLDLFWRQA